MKEEKILPTYKSKHRVPRVISSQTLNGPCVFLILYISTWSIFYFYFYFLYAIFYLEKSVNVHSCKEESKT